jgi:probable F420-dependent oxidoreductase
MKIDFIHTPTWLGAAAPAAIRARRLGFDGFFTADVDHEPFLPLAVAAAAQADMDYGTAIAVAFGRSPMVTATAAWDLAQLTGGRFLLGLGTQVKAHITRRFSMEWSQPVVRMGEYIAAMRAIWDSWQLAEPLRFRGDFYQFTLMTPVFNPGPIEPGPPPVYIAGVGPRMAALAGEVCDGYHIHPFHTVPYLHAVTLPAIRAGADRNSRGIDEIQLASSVFVVTGRTEPEMAAMRDAVKSQIAFYASTPAYAGVLDVHGWDVGPELTTMARRGRWSEMAQVITDDMVAEVAVVSPLDQLGAAVKARYDGLLDRIGLYTITSAMPDVGDDGWAALAEALR